MADANAIDSFFADQSQRVRGGKFFEGVNTGREAVAKADRAMVGMRLDGGRKGRAQTYAAGAWMAADDGASRFSAGLIHALEPALRDAVRTELIPWSQHVIDEWPVATGKSKSAIALDVDITKDGAVKFTLFGGDPKTFYVKYKTALRKETFKSGVLRYMANIMGTTAKVAASSEALALAAEQFKITRDEAYDIWTNRLPERVVYRLPNGADAQGEPAWVAQAQRPFKPMVERMAKVCQIELSRNATAFTARSK